MSELRTKRVVHVVEDPRASLLENMSRQELLDLQHVVLSEQRDIKQQVEDAKRAAHATGEYSDGEWFRKATYALRTRGILLARIGTFLSRDSAARKARNTELAIERRAKRMPQHLAYLHHFVRAAKQSLDAETYAQISATAGDRADAGDQFDCASGCLDERPCTCGGAS